MRLRSATLALTWTGSPDTTSKSAVRLPRGKQRRRQRRLFHHRRQVHLKLALLEAFSLAPSVASPAAASRASHCRTLPYFKLAHVCRQGIAAFRRGKIKIEIKAFASHCSSIATPIPRRLTGPVVCRTT